MEGTGHIFTRLVMYVFALIATTSCSHFGGEDCDVYLLFACLNSNAEDIQASDSTQFNMIELSPETVYKEQSHALLRINSVDANFSQTVGGFIRIQNTSIGPATVSGDAKLKYATLGFGGLKTPEGGDSEKMALLYYGGLFYLDMDLTIHHGINAYKNHYSDLGFYFQFGAIFNIYPSLSTGITLGLITNETDGLFGSQEIELIVRYKLLDNIWLAGGLRTFNHKLKGSQLNSDIDIGLSGPFFGLRINY